MLINDIKKHTIHGNIYTFCMHYEILKGMTPLKQQNYLLAIISLKKLFILSIILVTECFS